MSPIGGKSQRTKALELIRLGWSHEETAKAIGVDPVTLQELVYGKRKPPAATQRGGSFAASPEQRAKVRGARSIVSGEKPCDPAHLWARSLGGCADPLCVVALTRVEHEAYDAGELDLLPYLLKHRLVAEICHAVEHADGSLLRVLHVVTGTKWVPEGRA